mgnify:CR=1 FL=1
MLSSDEIKDAMIRFLPIKYDGIRYRRISAYIYRVIETNRPGVYKTALQCELVDRKANSVTIADSRKVELDTDGNQADS